MPTRAPVVPRDQVVRLWLHRQGLARPRGVRPLSKRRLEDHLERVGGVQLDPISVVGRALHLTLWSRFGTFDPRRLDRWLYRDRVGFEYWAHEASLVPRAALPLARRRMRRFPGAWRTRSWWPHYQTSVASRRRVLRRLRDEGPLESADFKRTAEAPGRRNLWSAMPAPKEDGRSLQILWHAGKVAIHSRREGRRVYAVAEDVYPEGETASVTQLEDSWLEIGLSGNGVAPERHLVGYLTAMDLDAAGRRRVIARALKRGRIVEVRIEGQSTPAYALPDHLDGLDRLPDAEGTTLLCPFDSFLWQRKRAAELLDFEYRVEIYTPPAKRVHGYYVLPILHDGRLVGRLDPKIDRDARTLNIQMLALEPAFDATQAFWRGLRASLVELGAMFGASAVVAPRDWRRRLGF